MKKMKRLIIILIVIIAAILLIHRHHQKQKQQDLPYVKAQTVSIKSISPQIDIVGSVVAAQQATLSAKAAGYINQILFQEGQFVKVGTPLIILDNSKIKSQLAADQISLKMAQHQFERDNILIKSGFITKQNKETDHVALASKQANVNEDQETLNDTIIRAPFDGYLGAKTINIGDYVTAGKPLVQLVDRDHLEVQYAVPANNAINIQLGSTIEVTSSLFPNQIFPGTITFIAPAIDQASRTLPIHAQLNDTKHLLLPGEFVNVKQPLGATTDAIFIPEETIVPALEGYSVFTLDKNIAKKIAVKLGQHQNGMVEITDGLQKDSIVIIQGQTTLQGGEKVKADFSSAQ